MPKVSDSYLETKRGQILDAAVNCFARNGFDATTIEDICREAGVSHGAIYRYFQSKEEIVEASFRRELETRKSRYAKSLHGTDARRGLDSYLSVYFQRRMVPEDETLMRFRMQLYGESARKPRMAEIQRQGQGEMLARVAEIIRSAQRRGEINPDLDAMAIARVLGALSDGLYVQRSVTPDMDVEKCLEAVKAVFYGNVWLGKREASHGKGRDQVHTKSRRAVQGR